MEGASKAQIITPRSITPTNESNTKKKKQDNNQSVNTSLMANTSLNTSSHNTSMPGPAEAASAKMGKMSASIQRPKEHALNVSANTSMNKPVNLKDTTPPKPSNPFQSGKYNAAA